LERLLLFIAKLVGLVGLHGIHIQLMGHDREKPAGTS
jgi:hypothetical protein